MTNHSNLRFEFKEKSLLGKVILVAGGTGGLGAATVALLMAEGAIPVVAYKDDHQRASHLKRMLEETYQRTLHLVAGDLSQPEVRTKYLHAASNVEGEMYGLVTFVGHPARVNVNEIKERDLQDAMMINYVTPLLLAKLVGEHFIEKEIEGSIILLSSMQGVAIFENSTNYAGPKAALIHGAKIFAKQWRGKNIRVNVIAPGVTRAGMAEESIRKGKYDVYLEKKIINRFGKAEDVAGAVRFLLEPDNYISGQVLTVDGGLTL